MLSNKRPRVQMRDVLVYFLRRISCDHHFLEVRGAKFQRETLLPIKSDGTCGALEEALSWWRDTQISRKRLAVRFMTVKSPLYVRKTCQVVNCLLCFDVGLSHFCLIKKKKKKKKPFNVSYRRLLTSTSL
jgi:hypothetical protein